MFESEVVHLSSKKKVWNPATLKWICIFLSVFSGVTLYIINFYRFNHPRKNKYLLLGLSILLITGLLTVLVDNGLFKYLIFIVNIGVAIYFSYEQKEVYDNYIENGGEKASSLIAWFFGVIILIVAVIIIGALLAFLHLV